jgi:hypothetical protein
MQLNPESPSYTSDSGHKILRTRIKDLYREELCTKMATVMFDEMLGHLQHNSQSYTSLIYVLLIGVSYDKYFSCDNSIGK